MKTSFISKFKKYILCQTIYTNSYIDQIYDYFFMLFAFSNCISTLYFQFLYKKIGLLFMKYCLKNQVDQNLSKYQVNLFKLKYKPLFDVIVIF